MRTTPPTTLPSIRDSFREDHARLDRLATDVLGACERLERERVTSLWSTFDEALVAHMGAEEKYMLPIVVRVSARDAQAIIQEHRHLRARLVELGAAVASDVVRLESVRGFIAELRAHATHEDAVLYRLADAQLDANERAALDQLIPRS